MRPETFEADRFAVLFPVANLDGSPFDTGTITVAEVLARRDGGTTVAASVAITDAGVIGVFAPNTLSAGSYRLQCRVTAPGGPQTTADTDLLVKPSLRQPYVARGRGR